MRDITRRESIFLNFIYVLLFGTGFAMGMIVMSYISRL